MTWSIVIDAWKRLVAQRVQQPDLEATGRMAVSRAAAFWCLGIYDPRRTDETTQGRTCKAQIDTFIRSDLGWTWEPPYAGDGAFEWCGAFAAACWNTIKPAIRKTYFASTYRLDRYARYASVNGEKNRGSGRLLAELDEHSTSLPWEPRAGDILTIGPAGSGYGKHICLVESFGNGVFTTIEGNGTGLAPNGKRWQGVVRGERKLGGDGWHARRLIRPSVEDLA